MHQLPNHSPSMKYLLFGACLVGCIAAILAKPFQLSCNPSCTDVYPGRVGGGMMDMWGVSMNPGPTVPAWSQPPRQPMPMQGMLAPGYMSMPTGGSTGSTLEQYAFPRTAQEAQLHTQGYSGYPGAGMMQNSGMTFEQYGQYGGMSQQPSYAPIHYDNIPNNMQPMQPMQPTQHQAMRGQFMNYKK